MNVVADCYCCSGCSVAALQAIVVFCSGAVLAILNVVAGYPVAALQAIVVFCSGAVLAILNVVADCSGYSVAALQAIVVCSGTVLAEPGGGILCLSVQQLGAVPQDIPPLTPL